MSDDVTGHGTNQPPQRPMWQVQPGPVTGPFSSPPTPAEGQPGQRIAQPDDSSRSTSPQPATRSRASTAGQQPYEQLQQPHEQPDAYRQQGPAAPERRLPGPAGGVRTPEPSPSGR